MGAVLVYAATGHGPFDGESSYGIGYRVVFEEPDLSGLPDEIRPLVGPCLAKEPADRPSVGELLAALSAPPPEEAGPRSRQDPRAAKEDTRAPWDTPPSPGTAPAPRDVPRDAAIPPAVGERPPDEAPAPPATPSAVPPAGEAAPPTPGGSAPAETERPAAAPEPEAATRRLRPRAPAGEFGPPPGESIQPTRPARRRRQTALIVAAAGIVVLAAVAVPLLVDRAGQGAKAAPDGGAAGASAGKGPATASPRGSTSATTPTAGFSCAGTHGDLIGSGSSALEPAMADWITHFEDRCPHAVVTYNPVGAGAGIVDFVHKNSAFAVGDQPLQDAEVQTSRTRCAGGGRAIDLPLAATPVVMAYKLSGVRGWYWTRRPSRGSSTAGSPAGTIRLSGNSTRG